MECHGVTVIAKSACFPPSQVAVSIDAPAIDFDHLAIRRNRSHSCQPQVQRRRLDDRPAVEVNRKPYTARF
jgi:hypothetical protein